MTAQRYSMLYSAVELTAWHESEFNQPHLWYIFQLGQGKITLPTRAWIESKGNDIEIAAREHDDREHHRASVHRHLFATLNTIFYERTHWGLNYMR